MTARLTRQARADLDDIAGMIGQDNPRASRNWLNEMRGRIQKLGQMPRMGVARPDLPPGLRLLPTGNYLILYRETPAGAEIIRILHSARQWQALL